MSTAPLEAHQLVEPVRVVTPWLIWQFTHAGHRFLVEETRRAPLVMPEFEWWMDYQKISLCECLTLEEHERWKLDLCRYGVSIFYELGDPPDVYITDAIVRVVNALVAKERKS